MNDGLCIHLRPQRWTEDGSAAVRGSAFIDGILHRPAQLARRLTRIASREELVTLLKTANGCFATVLRLPDGAVMAATDRARSIPLLYAQRGGALYLSDDANWIADRLGPAKPAPAALLDFRLAGYVTGSETLHPEIRQLRCAELLTAKPASDGWHCETGYYYRYVHEVIDDPGDEQLLDELDVVVRELTARLVEYAGGRQIVVPLTGGVDSGRIVMALRRAGYENILGFSYGVPGNPDAHSGERLARRLGISWAFVRYTAARWRQWFNSAERAQYYDYSDNLASLPVFQDWPAVGELIKSGRIVRDAVVAPGHAAECFSRPKPTPPDWPAFQEDRCDPDAVARALVQLHYVLREWAMEPPDLAEQLSARVLASLGDLSQYSSSAALGESWSMTERQAKFITNSMRAYEYWGLDWWLPLWDYANLDYWYRVPTAYRLNRRLSTLYNARLSREVLGESVLPDRRRLGGAVAQAAAAPVRRAARGKPALKRAYNLVRALVQYHSHPLAWHGLVRWRDFLKHYRGRANINTFLAMEWLGEIEFRRR